MLTVQPTTEKNIQQQITFPQLPLAVYREIAAHLRQIESVNAELIPYSLVGEQPKFDYAQSQIKGLSIEYFDNLNEDSKQRLTEILDYYAQRYCPWHQL